MVATFLAVLELMKSGRITLSEDGDHLFFNRQRSGSHKQNATDEKETESWN